MPFDPDAYLATTEGFDPDAYLGESVAPPAEPSAEPSTGDALLSGVYRGAWSIPGLLGIDNARAQAVFEYAKRKLRGEPADFASLEAGQRGIEAAREAAHPIATGFGIGAGSLPASLTMGAAMGPAAGAMPAASPRIASGVNTGLQSAAIEAGVTSDKPLGERLTRMGVAGGLGFGLGALVPGAPPRPAEAVPPGPPRLTPTAAASYLEREGVEGLTVGQRAPGSALGIIERVSADHPFGMAPQRSAAEESFMRVAQNKGVAPGAQPPVTQDLQARLAEIFDTFGPAYGAIEGRPIPADVIAEMPEQAIRTLPGIDAATRGAVQNKVGNALTVLPDVSWHPPGMHGGGKLEVRGLTPEAPEPVALMRPARGGEAYRGGEFPAPPPRGPQVTVDRKELLARAAERAARREPAGAPEERLIPGTTRPNPKYQWRVASEEPVPPRQYTAGDLLKVRENIRAERMAASRAEDFDRIALLDNAEDVVTAALQKALSPEEAAALQATDRQYARLMAAANAAPAGQTRFTPLQYLKQVERSAGRRNFKKGEAGDLQDLGEAAREVFTNAPMTGFRAGALSVIPGLKYAGAPLARLANTEAGRRFLFGTGRAAAEPGVSSIPGTSIALTPAMVEWLRAKYGLSPALAGAEGDAP